MRRAEPRVGAARDKAGLPTSARNAAPSSGRFNLASDNDGGEAVVPGERIELPTNGLQNRCSTAELTRPAGAF